MNRQRQSNMILVVIVLASLAATGCGSKGRQGIKGTVKLDGEPLAEGEIVFIPDAGTAGPTAGGVIKDGAYSVNSAKGTFPGTYRVEITAARPTGKKLRGPRGEEFDELANFLPARYNTSSELKAEVTSHGPNEFPFDLNTK